MDCTSSRSRRVIRGIVLCATACAIVPSGGRAQSAQGECAPRSAPNLPDQSIIEVEPREERLLLFDFIDPGSIEVIEPDTGERQGERQGERELHLFAVPASVSRVIEPYGRPDWLTRHMTLGTADYRPVCAVDRRTGRRISLPNPSLLQLPEFELASWGLCGTTPDHGEVLIIPRGEGENEPRMPNVPDWPR